MSNTAKNTTSAAETKVEETEIPTQKSSDAKSAAVLTIGDVLKAVESKKSEGMTVTLTLDENDEVQVQVNELTADGKGKQLVGKAKGLFQRNKKLVLATTGLVVTSLVLRALAARQAVELEADEVVESSDDIAVDA